MCGDTNHRTQSLEWLRAALLWANGMSAFQRAALRQLHFPFFIVSWKASKANGNDPSKVEGSLQNPGGRGWGGAMALSQASEQKASV